MDVVVDQVVAVLQVLTLRDAVCGDEHINDLWLLREEFVFFFRDRREECQYTIEIGWHSFNGGTDSVACHQTHMQSCFFFYQRSQVIVKIFCCIGEGCENEHLLVVAVNGMCKLLSQVLNKHLEFAVMLRVDVLDHH